MLAVGDSLSQKLNFRKLEVAVQSTIRTATSHRLVGDEDEKLTDVTRDIIEKEQFDRLVLTPPTIEVIKPDEDIKALKDKIQTSCMNTINIAENALTKHNSLKNVTIVSHSKVQCTADVDPLGLVDNLVIFKNKYMLA